MKKKLKAIKIYRWYQAYKEIRYLKRKRIKLVYEKKLEAVLKI